MSRLSKVLIFLGSAVALVVVVELSLRAGFGLGSPLLTLEDPQIGYMLRPGQSLRRFGQEISVNRFGMRSPDFPVDKPDGETRILVIGDSVVNGGTRIDQRDLATTRALRPIENELRQKVVIANVSADGWAPGNQAAYLERFGTFGAGTAILILSSHDAFQSSDAPFNRSIYPTENPATAIGEAWRLLARRIWEGSEPEPEADFESGGEGRSATDSLLRMMRLFKRNDVAVCILLHPTQHEIASQPDRGQAEIRTVAVRSGIRAVDLTPRYRAARRDASLLYRDDIHLNPAGQAVLADALIEAVRDELCHVPRG